MVTTYAKDGFWFARIGLSLIRIHDDNSGELITEIEIPARAQWHQICDKWVQANKS